MEGERSRGDVKKTSTPLSALVPEESPRDKTCRVRAKEIGLIGNSGTRAPGNHEFSLGITTFLLLRPAAGAAPHTHLPRSTLTCLPLPLLFLFFHLTAPSFTFILY